MTNIEFLAPIRALVVEYGMLPRGKKILLALSGGVDSMALLHALCELRAVFDFELLAAHYNHQLRGAASDRDASFVRAQCAARGIALHSGTGDVRAEASRCHCGIEEAARNMRYAFLEDVATQEGAQCIATAHHADDNLETLLLHLVRGAGLRGLSGIAPLRGRIIRPLLTTPRARIEDYAALCQIPFVEDESNADETGARNRLRHSVLPVLRTLNPSVSTACAASLRTLREDEAYLEAQSRVLFRAARRAEDGYVIEVSQLASTARPIAARVLRHIIEEIEAPMPSWVHLNGILAIAAGDDPAAVIHLPGGVLVQRVYADLLIAWDHENEPILPPDPCAATLDGETLWGDWRLQAELCTCPVGAHAEAMCAYISRERLSAGELSIRSRQIGDELALPARRRKSLKKLMIEEKVPRRIRECLPVLCDEAGLISVGSLGFARERLAQPGEDSLALTWTKIEQSEQ